MNYDDIKRALEAKKQFENAGDREALEKRKVIEASGAALTQIQKQTSLIAERRPDSIKNISNTEQLRAILEMLSRPAPPEWIQAKKNLEQFLQVFAQKITVIGNAVNAAAAATEPLVSFLQKLHEANQKLEELRRQSAGRDNLLSALAGNSIKIYESNVSAVTRRIEGQNLSEQNQHLAARLVLPSVSYVDFSRRTIGRISESNESEERSALGGSLVAAQEQLGESTRQIENIIIAPPEAGEILTLSPDNPFFNIYDEAQRDLMNGRPPSAVATYPLLLKMSSALGIAQLTTHVMNTLLRCNKTAAMRGAAEIFKPTTQAIEAMVVLPGIIVRNESALRDFVTYFYMLVYEGAGNQNLRFIKAQGGVLEIEDCDAIWNLKALRNKWLAHDPEHGKEKDIRASYRTLSEGLEKLGFRRFPREPREFESLQRRMLTDLLAFLEFIEDRLAGSVSDGSPASR